MAVAPRKILIIDDEPEILNLYSTALSKAGYQVEGERDGLRGLMAIDRGGYDLAILDVSMPNLDGFELAAAIRRHEQTKKLPFIFLTAHGDAGKFARGVSLGAKAYLTKPVPIAELLKQVARVLG